jgi:hypothetical protein
MHSIREICYTAVLIQGNIYAKAILTALGYTSKCTEAIPAKDRTWVAGVPTHHSDH